MKKKIHILIFLFWVILKSYGQGYKTYEQIFSLNAFTTTTVVGSSATPNFILNIQNNTVTLAFNSGLAFYFNSTTLKTGAIQQVNTTDVLPNVVLGKLKLANGIDTSYLISLENNWIVIRSNSNEAIPSMLGLTLTATLTPSTGATSSVFLAGNENYVRTIEAKVELKGSIKQYKEKTLQTVSYFDGLGRLKQNLQIGDTLSSKDIVNHIEYNLRGTKVREYLPFVFNQKNGSFIANAQNIALNYYNTEKYEFTANPYSEVIKDNSAMDNVVEVAFPGKSWKYDSSKVVETTNTINYEKAFNNSVLMDKKLGNFTQSFNSNLILNTNNGASGLITLSVRDGYILDVNMSMAGIVMSRDMRPASPNDSGLIGNITGAILPDIVLGMILYTNGDTTGRYLQIKNNQLTIFSTFENNVPNLGVKLSNVLDLNTLGNYINNKVINTSISLKYSNRNSANNTIKTDVGTNAENEVNYYGVKYTNGDMSSPNLVHNKKYAVNQLFKQITKDENWKPLQINVKDNTTEEFNDKNGRIVLKRAFNSNEVHDTYYVYDHLGNLIYVLPNLASNSLVSVQYDNFSKNFNHSVFSGTNSGGGSVNVTVVNNILTIAFSGSFIATMLNSTPQDLNTTPFLLPDMVLGNISNGNYQASIVGGKLKLTNLNNLTSVGFNTTFTVDLSKVQTSGIDKSMLDNLCYQYKYDSRKRLVDKKLPGKDWEYIVYDKLDRPILTQDGNLKTENKWMFTKYDTYDRPVYTGQFLHSTSSNRAQMQSLADAATSISETKQTINTINGDTVYYSNSAFPNNNITLYTISYYDNYNFNLDDGVAEMSYGKTPITNAKGLLTGGKVKVLGSNTWVSDVIYYDAKGRPIYNYNKNNYFSTTDKVKSKLDFTGKTVETITTHLKGTTTTTIDNRFTYNRRGQLLTQKQKINNQLEEFIVSNVYDDLGQLSNKNVGGKTIQSRLQNIDFNYNIRGWLKSINNTAATNNTIALGSGDLFGFQINYEAPSAGTALYNGNISQTFWKTANDPLVSSPKYYNYTYDALNRLVDATDNLGKFSETITYDKNGNIKTLKRLGEIVGGVPDISIATNFGVMDDLSYTYDGGNKLQMVSDNANDSYGFKDDIVSSSPDTTMDYTYDANGNMLTDTNKGINSNILYNHLNLPTKIILPTGNISYVYKANGEKVQKVVYVTPTASTTTTDYINGYVYQKVNEEPANLKFFPTAEGYVANNVGVFSYIYQYKDHLGNIRLSYGDVNNDGAVNSSEIIEENNYYPFGLKHKGYNSGVVIGNANVAGQKYKYNGKELQEELQLNVYDYGARNYDPALGRWMNIDPLAEKSRRFNPYTYALDNPIYFIDPDGMEAKATYGINAQGRINKIDDKKYMENGKEVDRIYAVDDEGNKKDLKDKDGKDVKDYVSVDKGFINKNNSDNESSKSIFITSNTIQAKEAYIFFANNSKVEFSLSIFTNKNDVSVINTSHEKGAISGGTVLNDKILNRPGISLKYNSHSHPSKYNAQTGWPAYPSGFGPDLKIDFDVKGADRNFYRYLNLRHPNTTPSTFNVYIPSAPNINVNYNSYEATRN